MTSPTPSLPPAIDVLGSPEPARRGGRAGRVAAALVGAGALAVAGSAVAVAAYLGGGGAQPEDVVPGNALGMVKVDLDPAASQKVAVYRLAKRFPATEGQVDDESSVKDQLLSALFGEQQDVDYDADVKPWIGDRVALAVLPGGDEPAPLAAVAYTDRGKAEAALERLREQDDSLFYAFSAKADYVLLGDAQEVVDDAAGTEQVLADADSWKDGMDALDGDQILTLWADLDAVYDALPQEARDEAAQAYGLEGELELGGTVVAGVRAGSDHVELVGRAIDLESPVQSETPVGGGKGSGLVRDLPDDTIAALSVTDLGAGLTELFDTAYGEDDPLGLVASAQELGLRLPEDLRTLLGDETVAAVLGEQDFALRTRTDDSGAALAAWSRVTALAGGGDDPSAMLREVDGGIAVGSNPEALDRIAGGGDLGRTDAFRAAVPDAEDAGYLLYVDLARALELTGADLGPDAAVLRSVGLSGSGDATSSAFRLRLTVRD